MAAASLGALSELDRVIYQWQEGERRLAAVPVERRALLQRIVDELAVDLRRRLGGRFAAQELAELYGRGTAWCLEVAMATAPDAPWAWDSRLVVDAAFARYLREAVDYAGGRLIAAEG